MYLEISEGGVLFIKRRDGLTKAICPYSDLSLDENSYEDGCGDWCALFGEPVQITYFRDKQYFEWELQLCKKTLRANELIDKRIPEDNKQCEI
jgi:hypothetical protein